MSQRIRQVVAVAAAGVLGVALLVWMGWTVWSTFSGPRERQVVTRPSPTETPAGPALARAPREPRASRPREELEPATRPGRYDAAPPLAIAQSGPEYDPEIVAWLEQWQADILAGRQRSPEHRTRLDTMLQTTPLSSVQLYQIGIAVAFIEDEDQHRALSPAARQAARPWFLAAVRRAEIELAAIEPGDPRAQPILDTLVGVRNTLERLGERQIVQHTAQLRLPYEQAGSEEAWRAELLNIHMIYTQGRYAEALQEIDRVERQYITDATSLEDRLTLAWMRGICLYYDRRFEDAIPVLEQILEHPDFRRAPNAARLLVLAFAQVGRFDDARRQFEQYVRQHNPDPGLIESTARQLQRLEQAFTAADSPDQNETGGR